MAGQVQLKKDQQLNLSPRAPSPHSVAPQGPVTEGQVHLVNSYGEVSSMVGFYTPSTDPNQVQSPCLCHPPAPQGQGTPGTLPLQCCLQTSHDQGWTSP